tara:strand:- start:225 stop:962 length:738 start_codon:yes stop_codon:yes gene_type:complete
MKTISQLLKSEAPTYELKLPLSNKTVKYTPFRVKEEKILLMALEDGTESAMLNAIKNLVDACTETDLIIGDIPIFELEYLFINIRAKSVGEIAEPTINCQHTGKITTGKINLTEVKPPNTKTIIDNKIKIRNSVGVSMKPPSINSLLENKIKDLENTTPEETINLVCSCIDEIWTEDEVFKVNELPKEEIVNFVESMSPTEFEKLTNYFQSIPALTHTIKYSVLNEENKREEYELVLNGMNDFFG